ncbi:MAG: hypothetical protein AB8E15_07320 [Bdellovibrionales bacterium]
MKFAMIAALSLFLVSCVDIEGELKVDSPISFKVSDDETIELNEGTYQAEVEFKRRNRVRFTIKDVNGEEERVTIRFPKDIDIPSDNGEFFVEGERIDQNFDVQGYVQTEIERGERRTETQRCEYRRWYRECRRTRRGTICRDVQRTFYGRQWVDFRLDRINKDVEILFQSGVSVQADFTAESTRTRRVTLHEGRCQ